MYINYAEYKVMGGVLDEAAFLRTERTARYFINSQAGGLTGERIGKLSELPQAVKDCMVDLIALFSVNSTGKKQISGESQSQGGVSESYSYVTKTDDEINQEAIDIVEKYFYGGGIGNLLYRGASI